MARGRKKKSLTDSAILKSQKVEQPVEENISVEKVEVSFEKPDNLNKKQDLKHIPTRLQKYL